MHDARGASLRPLRSTLYLRLRTTLKCCTFTFKVTGRGSRQYCLEDTVVIIGIAHPCTMYVLVHCHLFGCYPTLHVFGSGVLVGQRNEADEAGDERSKRFPSGNWNGGAEQNRMMRCQETCCFFFFFLLTDMSCRFYEVKRGV